MIRFECRMCLFQLRFAIRNLCITCDQIFICRRKIYLNVLENRKKKPNRNEAFTRSGTQQLVCIYFQCVYCFHLQMSFNRWRERASWDSHSGKHEHTRTPCCEFFESDAKIYASALVCVHIQRICCTSAAHRGIFSWMCADNVVDSDSAPHHFWHICVSIVKRNWKHNSRHHLRSPVIFTVRLDSQSNPNAIL